jgi:hypothetical protein
MSKRTIHVKVPKADSGDVPRFVHRLEAYLPEAYKVAHVSDNEFGQQIIVVTGHDRAGWTAEEYVLPRLQSGLIWAEIIS